MAPTAMGHSQPGRVSRRASAGRLRLAGAVAPTLGCAAASEESVALAHRMTIVSPMAHVIPPVDLAVAAYWPSVQKVYLVDESLYAELGADRVITPLLERRLDTLLHYAADCGADGIVFAGSVFGAPVARARRTIGVPVFTAYEAMIEAAFTAGRRIGVLTTSPWTMQNITADISDYAMEHGIAGYELVKTVDEAARPVILAGDLDGHDRMVAATARGMADVDVLILGQFSMGTAATLIRADGGRPVLTAPETAVQAMRRRLEG